MGHSVIGDGGDRPRVQSHPSVGRSARRWPILNVISLVFDGRRFVTKWNLVGQTAKHRIDDGP